MRLRRSTLHFTSVCFCYSRLSSDSVFWVCVHAYIHTHTCHFVVEADEWLVESTGPPFFLMLQQRNRKCLKCSLKMPNRVSVSTPRPDITSFIRPETKNRAWPIYQWAGIIGRCCRTYIGISISVINISWYKKKTVLKKTMQDKMLGVIYNYWISKINTKNKEIVHLKWNNQSSHLQAGGKQKHHSTNAFF